MAPNQPPVEIQVGGVAASVTNPLSVALSTGGGAAVPGNPIPVIDIIGSQSLQANGTATTPTAGSAIATITTPPAGTYRVRLTYQLSGTAETLVKNLRLSGTTLNTDFETLGTSVNNVVVDAMTMDGATSIVAKAVALATTGAVYTVTLVATRLF